MKNADSYNYFSSNIVSARAQGATQHSVKHKKTASLHFICYRKQKKRGGGVSNKNPLLIWEYLAMHN